MGSTSVFFVGWESIGRVVIISVLCYTFLIIMLRAIMTYSSLYHSSIEDTPSSVKVEGVSSSY